MLQLNLGPILAVCCIPLLHRLVFYFRETRHFREKRGGVQQVVHVGEICFLGAQKKNTQIHSVCELMDRAEVTARKTLSP